jgi:spermidine synthase
MLYNSGESLAITIGDAKVSPTMVYFGTDYRPADPSRWVVPLWAIGATFFALISLAFVGLGQVMGRQFRAIPNRVSAYTTDVLGSLAGIAAFALMSAWELPPLAWFLPAMLLALYFAPGRGPVQLVCAAGTLLLVAVSSFWLPGPLGGSATVRWSPYYKVSHFLQQGAIRANNMSHQTMLDIASHGPAYLMPHLINRDAGGRPFEDVLIIGAGSGNDVAAALLADARRIDAVEIDPVIQRIGRDMHPNRPYANPRVSVHIDDGRGYLRNSERKYDLVVYALVDSLMLHSGYSSIRLENFLFTREAFEDVKRRLKPDGVFVMYNFYRHGWVVGRLAGLTEEVFGAQPLVISMPYRERIDRNTAERGDITFLLAGASGGRMSAIRASYLEQRNFWVGLNPAESAAVNGFRADPPGPASAWRKAAPAQVDVAGSGPLPSDDWPQLYLRERTIPWAPIGQGLVTVAALSLLILFAFSPVRPMRIQGQMFFLGAGFMLLETKGVVHMALLFGSTWIVNSIVFAAILVMILFANLFVAQVQPKRLGPCYGFLIVALLVNAIVPMNLFLALEPVARTVASCAVVFVPVFFAGVIFAAAFRESSQPHVDFGSNIAGVVLGGLSEQLSLVLGFDRLILVAIAYYLLSLALRPRVRA